jgi:hypothetical protein
VEPRKRSNAVTLTLVGLPLGAIMLADAFPGQPMQRNFYRDSYSCIRDYSPQQCQPNSSGSSSPYGFHGPYYRSDRTASAARSDPGPGRFGTYTSVQTSVRGGFGAFGRAMRAGG